MKRFNEFLNEGNKKMKLFSDVDGVILDFTGGMKAWLRVNYPELMKDWKDTDWGFGMGHELAYKLVGEFWESPNFRNGLNFVPGAVKGINELAKNFDLHIVSAVDEKYFEYRKKNLEDVNYKTIKVMNKGKLDYVINNVKPDIGIEDKPEYIEKMVKAGIDVYYPDIPITRKVTVGTRYKTWTELVKIIKEKYL